MVFINQGKQVERLGTAETNWQPLTVQLNQNDNPIRSRFAAIFESENFNQLQNAIAYLPYSGLLKDALTIKNTR